MKRDHTDSGFRISRDQARSIAEAYLRLPTTNLGGTRVREVRHANSDGFRRPALYEVDLSGAWIVYVDRPVTGLRPSAIVCVSDTTGSVLYAGSANDEG